MIPLYRKYIRLVMATQAALIQQLTTNYQLNGFYSITTAHLENIRLELLLGYEQSESSSRWPCRHVQDGVVSVGGLDNMNFATGHTNNK